MKIDVWDGMRTVAKGEGRVEIGESTFSPIHIHATDDEKRWAEWEGSVHY